jgi:uncharacterized membrane-anchored protein YitT (DUF2179 family)
MFCRRRRRSATIRVHPVSAAHPSFLLFMNAPLHHNLFEDAQALVAAALVGSLGLSLLKDAGLITGGTVGLAFLVHYASGAGLGTLVFAINVPFVVFAWFQVGRAFAIKTLCAIGCCHWRPTSCRAASASEPSRRSTRRSWAGCWRGWR